MWDYDIWHAKAPGSFGHGSRVFGHGSVVFGFVVLGNHKNVLLFQRVGNLLGATRAHPCGMCAHVASKVWRWTKVVSELTCQRVKGVGFGPPNLLPSFVSFWIVVFGIFPGLFCKLDWRSEFPAANELPRTRSVIGAKISLQFSVDRVLWRQVERSCWQRTGHSIARFGENSGEILHPCSGLQSLFQLFCC